MSEYLGEALEKIQIGPIEIKTVDQVRIEPYNIPEAFEWCNI